MVKIEAATATTAFLGPRRALSRKLRLKVAVLLARRSPGTLNEHDEHLAARGALLRGGTIGDATLSSASPSTKNREGKREPETAATRHSSDRVVRVTEVEDRRLAGNHVAPSSRPQHPPIDCMSFFSAGIRQVVPLLQAIDAQ